MAVRYRKGRASPWQAYWNNPVTGKRESKNFLDQKEAEKYDALIKYRIKYEKEFFQKEEKTSEQDEQSCVTLQALFVEYLKRKQFGKEALSSNLSNMRLILAEIGNMDIQDINKELIKGMIAKHLATGVKATTVYRRFSILRTVLRFGVDNGYLATAEIPKLPICSNEKIIPPTPRELQAMLEVAPEHIKRVIILGSQCGMRIGKCELLRLKWQDVDFDRAVLCVHGSKKNINALWREVPLRQSLLDIMRAWYEIDRARGQEYLVHWQGKSISRMQHSWAMTLKHAGITRRIRPYDLRHAFATEAIAGGADVGTVASLMGHANPVVLLKHYQYILNTQKRAAIEALPELNYVPNAMCPKSPAPDFINNQALLQ